MSQPAYLIRVTDIKQWFYCPRVVYFTYLMPVQKKITPKMEMGAEEHAVISALERRRKLREYGLTEGERHFHVPLRSTHLGLSGLLDLLLISGSDYIPVEFKDTTRGVSLNHKYQLAAYALLLEDVYSCQVDRGFVYQIPNDRITLVRLDRRAKDGVRQAVSEIHAMIAAERMPDPPAQRGKCTDCEFLHFCGDRF